LYGTGHRRIVDRVRLEVGNGDDTGIISVLDLTVAVRVATGSNLSSHKRGRGTGGGIDDLGGRPIRIQKGVIREGYGSGRCSDADPQQTEAENSGDHQTTVG